MKYKNMNCLKYFKGYGSHSSYPNSFSGKGSFDYSCPNKRLFSKSGKSSHYRSICNGISETSFVFSKFKSRSGSH